MMESEEILTMRLSADTVAALKLYKNIEGYTYDEAVWSFLEAVLFLKAKGLKYSRYDDKHLREEKYKELVELLKKR